MQGILVSLLLVIYCTCRCLCQYDHSVIPQAMQTNQEDDVHDDHTERTDLYSSHQHFVNSNIYENNISGTIKRRVPRNAGGRQNGNRSRRQNQRNNRNRTARNRTTTPRAPEEVANQHKRNIHPMIENGGHPWTNTCQPCIWREERKQLRLEMIKNDILQKTQMKDAPTNVTYPPHPPLSILKMGEGTNNFGQMPSAQPHPDYKADTLQIATPAESPPERLGMFEGDTSLHAEDVIYFNLQPDILNSDLHSAILHIYIKPRNYSNIHVQYLKVFRIIKPHYVKSYTYDVVPDIKKKIALTANDTGKWYHLNLTSVVEKWMANRGQENYGLYISSKDFNQTNFAVIHPHPDSEDYVNKPWLKVRSTEYEVITPTPKRQRQRRGHYKLKNHCTDTDKEERCCRYNFKIDFKELNWDWVVYPKSFDAFYCGGSCDISFMPHSTHAYISSMIFGNGGNHTTGGPCCTPVEMNPLTIIYYDHKRRFVVQEIDSMVTKRCGCN